MWYLFVVFVLEVNSVSIRIEYSLVLSFEIMMRLRLLVV